jgi:uncharacterized protein YacL
LIFALVGWQIGSIVGDASLQPRNAVLGIAIGAVLGAAIAPYVVQKPYAALRTLLHRLPTSELLTAAFGLILGLVVAALLAYPLSFLPWALGHLVPALAAVACGYLGVSVARMRHRDLVHLASGRTDLPADAKVPAGRYLVDTSAIIDGRIADVAETGFLMGTLVVPRFVLLELQYIADSADPLRRNRGKRGLEMLKRLQSDSAVSLSISDDDPVTAPDVDAKLVQLARTMHCPVITNDYNLNRIADLQGVRVLNVNILANAVKPVVIPGEEMRIHIIQEGRELNQGVAYLDDGTMIVVEGGKRLLHQSTEVVVTRVLQTAAGRMIFAYPKTGVTS